MWFWVTGLVVDDKVEARPIPHMSGSQLKKHVQALLVWPRDLGREA